MIYLYDVDDNGDMHLAWHYQDDNALGPPPDKLEPQQSCWSDLVHPDEHDRLAERLQRLLAGEPSVDEFRMAANDEGGHLRVCAVPEWDADKGRVVRIFGTCQPLAAPGEAGAGGAHDPVTGLPGQAALHAVLQQAIERRQAGGAPISLMTVDLDCYNDVAQDFGTASADAVLKTAAERLRGSVDAEAVVARLYGDHFAVFVPDVELERFRACARRCKKAVEEPIDIDGVELHLDPVIGLAQFPQHGEAARYLLRRSVIAAGAARASGRAFAIYEADHERRVRRNVRLLADLRRAIEADELALHFQPSIDLRSGRIVRAEALLRWTHPEQGQVSPGTFIPMAERTGVIQPLTLWVLERALVQHDAWRRQGRRLGVTVNVSVRNLLEDSLHRAVDEAFARGRIAPGELGIEVTESEIMRDPDACVEALGRLRALGADILVDDFGTGQASLVYLQRLPLTVVKIDRSFVRDVAQNATNRAIVRMTVTLARELGLGTVAEGVESEADRNQLRELGCREAQGFHIARPQPAADLETWLDGLEETG